MSSCSPETMINHHELGFLARLGDKLHVWRNRWEQRHELASGHDERDEVDQPKPALNQESGDLRVGGGEVGHGRWSGVQPTPERAWWRASAGSIEVADSRQLRCQIAKWPGTPLERPGRR